MACTDFENRLNAYFDREMSSDERAAFMDELRTNAQYRWDFKLYRKMFQVMEQLEVDSPEDLPERIKTEIRRLREAEGKVASGPWFFGNPASVALSAAAVFFFALFLGRESKPAPLPAPIPVVQIAETTRSISPAVIPAPAPAAIPAQQGDIRVIPDGRVEVMRKGSITWTLAHAGDRISYEDKVRTGETGTVRLVYPDRAWIKVKGGSLVQVLDEAVRVFQGDTWIKVEKTGSRFEARTPNAVASVRGTMYSVHVERIPLSREQILNIATQGTTQSVSENFPHGTSNAAVSAASTQVSLARHLWKNLLGGFRTDVHVHESVVAVAALDPETGRPAEEQLVRAGEGLEVRGAQLASIRPLKPEHYHAWKLPVPSEILHPAPITDTVEATEPTDVAEIVPVDADPPATESGPAAGSAGRPGSGVLGFQGLNRNR